jgi:hypothetical protein
MRLRAALDVFATEIAEAPSQRELCARRGPRCALVVFLVGLAIVLGLQGLVLANRATLPKVSRQGTSGFSHHFAKHFVYHYYLNDLFPVAQRDENFTAQDFTVEGARRQLDEKGASLVNEWGHWTRLGEHVRILTYAVDVLLRGVTENPDNRPFNILVLWVALACLWGMSCLVRRPVLGFIVTVLVGSSPYLLYETYQNKNIFGLHLSVGLLLTALYLPIIDDTKFRRAFYVLPVLAGLVLGTMVNIRAETLPILVCGLGAPFLRRELRWRRSLTLAGLLLLSHTATDKAWDASFNRKWDEAIAVVSAKGGNPYVYPRISSHNFWHPVFCGLGDYDTTHGYEWKDQVAYRYGVPKVKERYGIELRWNGTAYWLDETYDPQGFYYKKFDEVPEYEQVVKDKVLSDIAEDPLWYLGILGKRVAGFFGKTAPLALRVGPWALPIPWSGWLVLPVMGLLLLTRRWFLVKLLVFTTPLAASSIIIYGGGNSTYNSLYPLLTLAILVSWLFELGSRALRRRAQAH